MSTSLKTISVDKGLDTIINEGINVFRRFGKENSAINTTDFYAGNRFALFIDLRSMRDKDLHGSGLRLVNKKKLSSELTGKHRVQGMLNVISSSSRMLSSSSLTVGWKA